jgi:8-oxo-dGTP diphosphatase
MKGHIKFAVLSTDIAVLTVDGENVRILLAKATSKNFRGVPALPGGLIEPGELAEQAARRILVKYLSVSNYYSEQLYTFDSLKRDPAGRVVSVAYFVLLPWNKAKLSIKNGAWWESIKNLPNLAYDHNEIVKTAVKRLRGKITYTNVVFALMPEEFTLPELQKTYECILDKNLDKRNFRKKIFSLKILEKLAKQRRQGANRPARLYKFKSKRLDLIEIV